MLLTICLGIKAEANPRLLTSPQEGRWPPGDRRITPHPGACAGRRGRADRPRLVGGVGVELTTTRCGSGRGAGRECVGWRHDAGRGGSSGDSCTQKDYRMIELRKECDGSPSNSDTATASAAARRQQLLPVEAAKEAWPPLPADADEDPMPAARPSLPPPLRTVAAAG